ncbi:MAG: hypothetical protein KatS3mg105_4217 [Gemmatales bacterium]|nr:MAG: hypothetical protein KatS3mg105_4217 [Gemmatales bacterium]
MSNATANSVRCPKCKELLRVREDQLGKRVKCSKCGNILRLVVAGNKPKTQPNIDLGNGPGTVEMKAPGSTMEIDLAAELKKKKPGSSAEIKLKKKPGSNAEINLKKNKVPSTGEIDLAKHGNPLRRKRPASKPNVAVGAKPSALADDDLSESGLSKGVAIISTIFGTIFLLLLAVGGIGLLYWISGGSVDEIIGSSEVQVAKGDESASNTSTTPANEPSSSPNNKPGSNRTPDSQPEPKQNAELMPQPRPLPLPIPKPAPRPNPQPRPEPGPKPKPNPNSLAVRPKNLQQLVGHWKGIETQSTVAIRADGHAVGAFDLDFPEKVGLERFAFSKIDLAKEGEDYFAQFQVGSNRTKWKIMMNKEGTKMEFLETTKNVSLFFSR